MGRGKLPPPPETEKYCCRKMELFSRAVENDKGPGRWNRKWIKGQFSIEIFICKFQNFSTNFNFHWFLAQTGKNLSLGFLNSFRIIKDVH